MPSFYCFYRNPASPVKVYSPTWPPYDVDTTSYLDISHDQLSANQHFRQPYMTFWTKIVPSLLNMSTENTCNLDCNYSKERGQLFRVNMHVAENIILSLSIISGCLLLAVLLICALSVAKQHKWDYNFR